MAPEGYTKAPEAAQATGEVAFADFLERVELIFVLDHAGRAGNGFFLTIFDQHPEVLACPWMHYVYSYIVSEFGEGEIDCGRLRDFWTREFYFRFLYNDLDDALADELRRFGADPDAPLDRARVRQVFDGFLEGRAQMSRKELVVLTYYAFAAGLGRDLGQVRYIMVADSISLRSESPFTGFSGRVIDAAVHDFPEARLIHLVRDPRAGFASTRHQFVNSLGNMYGIRWGSYWRRFRRLLRRDWDWDSVFVFGFWLVYFAAAFRAAERKKAQYARRFTTIRNEDLNLNFEPSIAALAIRLGVRCPPAWGGAPFVPTMLGRPWTGTGAYNSRYQTHRYGPLANDREEVARQVTGPNAYVTERWKTRLSRSEIYLIERLLAPEIRAYGYAFLEYRPGRRQAGRFELALAVPLTGELPSPLWILKGFRLGLAEVVQRLFYLYAFPLFYVAARLVLRDIVRRGRVFAR